MGITGIHHVCINTGNILESIDFYCSKLGFELIDREHCSFGEYALVKLGSAVLELIQPPLFEAEMSDNGQIAHIGLAVENLYDLFDDLTAKGVVFKDGGVSEGNEPLGGMHFASLCGPGGEVINLYEFISEKYTPG